MSTADETHPIDDLVCSVRPFLAAHEAEDAAIDAARRRLHGAITRPAPRTPQEKRRRAWRPVLATMPIVISGGVALVIAAVAFIALGGHGRSHPQATLRGPVAGPGADALIAKLAVLRRPQTAADRLPAKLHIPNVYASKPLTIIPSLSRLVATPPGAKIYLVVTEPARGNGTLWSPSLGDQLNIVAITKSGAITEGAGYPAADITDPTNVYASGIKLSNARQSTRAQRLADAYDVAIVPDGVAHVRWTFATRAGTAGPVITVPVANNVAITKLTPAHARVLHTTWYAPNGHVVPTSNAPSRRILAAQDASRRRAALAAARRSHVTATPAILHAFAVFDFGSRSGTRVAHGYIISHPSLAQLPVALLPGGLGGPRSQQDLRDVRKIVAPSGQTLYIIPGVNTICLFAVEISHLPYQRASSTDLSGGCAPTLARALKDGTGETSTGSRIRGSMVYMVVPRTTHNYKLQTGRHAFRTIHPVDGVVVAHTPFRFG